MLNNVNKLIIGKSSGAVSTASVTHLTTAGNVANVVAGDVFVVNSAMKVIAAAADVTPVIYIAQGISAGKFKLSNPIVVGDITNMKSQAYSAAAQKQVAAGNTGSGTEDIAANLVSGRKYKFSVLLKDDQRFMNQRQTRRDYSFVADFAASAPTSAEAAAFLSQFIDAVNDDAFLSDFVVASATLTGAYHGILTTGIAQTFNAYNNRAEYVDFTVSFSDITDTSSTYYATVTDVVAYNPGNGTPEQIRVLENKMQTWEGFTNKTQFPVIAPTLFSSLTTNYDVITIEWLANTPGILEGRDFKPLSVQIALCTASAQFAAIVTALELLNNAGAGTISNNASFVDADV